VTLEFFQLTKPLKNIFNYTQKFNIFSQDQEEKNINNNNSIIDVMLKETDNKTVYLKDSIKTERDFTNKNFLEGAVLEISMVAKYKVWVEIKNSKGNMIISRIFEKGDKYKFPKGSNYNLSTNDASGLKFYNAEKLLVLAGKSEEILSDININEYLINIK